MQVIDFDQKIIFHADSQKGMPNMSPAKLIMFVLVHAYILYHIQYMLNAIMQDIHKRTKLKGTPNNIQLGYLEYSHMLCISSILYIIIIMCS